MMTEGCRLHDQNISLKIKGVEQHVKALIELHEQSTAYEKDRLNDILCQVTLTNGRVTSIEEETSLWRWLARKPYRLVISIVVILVISKLVTNEQIYMLIIRLFT